MWSKFDNEPPHQQNASTRVKKVNLQCNREKIIFFLKVL